MITYLWVPVYLYGTGTCLYQAHLSKYYPSFSSGAKEKKGGRKKKKLKKKKNRWTFSSSSNHPVVQLLVNYLCG
jgi:hypothetical protein